MTLQTYCSYLHKQSAIRIIYLLTLKHDKVGLSDSEQKELAIYKAILELTF